MLFSILVSIFEKACEMGIFSKRQRLRICSKGIGGHNTYSSLSAAGRGFRPGFFGIRSRPRRAHSLFKKLSPRAIRPMPQA